MKLMFRELSRLFASPSRLKLLKYFVLQPNVKATAKDAAQTVGIARATAETELRSLARSGVLTGKRNGKKLLYSFSPNYRHADALSAFLESVTRPEDKTIADAFKGVPGVTLLVATGILARDIRPEVDLLVVTRRPKDMRIERAVRKVEANASIPIRYAVLEAREYEQRLVARDRLLRDVFEFTHNVILGRV